MNLQFQFQSIEKVCPLIDNSHYGIPPSKGSITSVQSWLDTGENYQTSTAYGSKGELVEETDALGRTTKYQYDSTKTFPEQIINLFIIHS